MDFRKIANFFCDLICEISSDSDIMCLVKRMILTTNFTFSEINWCFPLCTREFYYKALYSVIAQYKDYGHSDQVIIEALEISKEDFKKAISYAEDDTNE